LLPCSGKRLRLPRGGKQLVAIVKTGIVASSADIDHALGALWLSSRHHVPPLLPREPAHQIRRSAAVEILATSGVFRRGAAESSAAAVQAKQYVRREVLRTA